MKNIYSTEYNNRYSKVGNFMASFGITMLVAIGEIGMVIVIMIVKTIMAAVTTDSEENFNKAMDEIFSRSDFFAKTTLLITTIALIIVFICYYFSFVKHDMRKGIYESVFPKLKDKRLIGFIVCATISAFGVAGVLSGIISSLLPEKAETLTEVFEDLKLSGYLYFLDVVILGPIFEELVMRGLILKTSKKAFGMIGCMIINAILFSVFHGNIIQGFYTLPIGLFYAFLAFQFNSVIPTIFCHMFHNLLSTFFDFGGVFGIVLDILLFLIFGA
ncbi:MAG: CPBP family intramembrane metalloprotease, partial [Lachnospiraceae bacterium]|nr:CPBP family intramembrane metalloprotease [Lachnospiraceae bacterium]